MIDYNRNIENYRITKGVLWKFTEGAKRREVVYIYRWNTS
jgi:hypothetical protein